MWVPADGFVPPGKFPADSLTATPASHMIPRMKIKTEHSGAKRGSGAYYGRKRDAKRHSNKVRRAADKKGTA